MNVDSVKGKLPGRHWLMLGVTVLLFGLVALFVDLHPQVQENFFFSPRDPQYRESAKIDRIFPSHDQLIVSVSGGSIGSAHYLERVGELTRKFEAVKGVSSVESLTEGPKDFEDAEKSPFWGRLLLAKDRRSSNIIVFASARDAQQLIAAMEEITSQFEAKDFRIEIAGAPYVSEMLRRSLAHDFHLFSLTSVLLFALAMWALFRS